MDWLERIALYVFGVGSYWLKRRLERKPERENVDLLLAALEVNRERMDQGISLEDLPGLVESLTPSSTSSTEPAADVGGVSLSADEVARLVETIGTLFEVLATHAGDNALAAASLQELFPKRFPVPRLERAQATFHKALWGMREMGWSSANFDRLQEKYEPAIPFPAKYRQSDFWRDRGLAP